jgi:hypothetical protein
MVYARVHDRTVAQHYYVAMAQIERSLVVDSGDESCRYGFTSSEWQELVELIDRMAKPRLPQNERLQLVEAMRAMAHGEA